MNQVKYYRVHVGFITSNGVVVKPGVYPESELDIAEASRRSYVTVALNLVPDAADITVDKVESIEIKQSGGRIANSDIAVVKLDAEVTSVRPVEIYINTADVKTIVDLKFVGQKTASRVINERQLAVFESYKDLNKRVPLGAGKKWEAVAHIKFELEDNRSASSKPAYEVTNTAS